MWTNMVHPSLSLFPFTSPVFIPFSHTLAPEKKKKNPVAGSKSIKFLESGLILITLLSPACCQQCIMQVMLLWTAAFWFIGSWMIPFAAHIAGFGKESLSFRGQALFSLVTDVTEGLAGIAILQLCLSRFRPLPPDWFRFSLKGKWQLDVIFGCLMFPLVNRLSQFNLDLLPLLPSTPVTLSSVEQSIIARDPVAMVLYAVVVSICAPVWEEIVFRGFLLPSLTKYMPVWCAILVSSVAFALAHFNIQRMLPLIFLGMVMGVLFTRSRNLLPSMLLHSLWNGFIFLDLMK